MLARMSTDYYTDYRYCDSCRKYVRFLSAPRRGYCVHCSQPVKLFSDSDLETFQAEVKRQRAFELYPV